MANTLNLGTDGNWAVKKDSLLAYNSENNNFKPLAFDFTRASSATVVNKAGLIETVGSGQPRIDFLGNTKGALKLEPQRTNLITYSESFPNSYWTKSGASIQGDPSTAGSELVTNGDFATDSDWIKGGTAVISSGSASFSSNGDYIRQSSIFSANVNYKITFDVNVVSGLLYAAYDGTNGPTSISEVGSATRTVYYNTPTGGNLWFYGINFIGSIDNVSVKEVQGFSSPDGSLNSFKLVEDGANSRHRVGRATFASGTQRTFSVFAKKGERDYISLFDNNVVGDALKGVIFNLNTGTLSLNNSDFYYLNPTIKSLGNGWYICSVTWTPTALSVPSVGSSADGLTNSYQGDGTSGVYIYGAQLEVGNYSTSLINTQGTIKTRVADACTNGGNEQVINSTEGVLYAEMRGLANDLTYRSIGLNSGSATNRLLLTFNNVSNNINFLIQVGGVTQVNINYASANITSNNKIALKYKLNDFALWVNGVEVGTDTSGVTFTLNTLNNVSFDNSNGADNFYGNVKDVRVYNTALTDSELAILTTI